MQKLRISYYFEDKQESTNNYDNGFNNEQIDHINKLNDCFNDIIPEMNECDGNCYLRVRVVNGQLSKPLPFGFTGELRNKIDAIISKL